MATKGITVQASVLFNGTQAMKELEQLKKRAEALDEIGRASCRERV